MNTKIAGTTEAWESRELGADAAFVKRVDEALANQVEDAAGLQMISIRLDKCLIDTFKLIGEFHGVGYQPLMRDALKRFAEHELKNIVHGFVESQRTAQRSPTPAKPPTKKTTPKPDDKQAAKRAA